MRQHGPWRVLRTREVYRDDWVALAVDDVIRPDGSAGTFSVVEVRSGACALPLDRDGCVHLVEQFRYAEGRQSLEAVGGAGERGEVPLETARRELKEELGIEASEWDDLGTVVPFPSMVRSTTRLFLARGLSFGERTPDRCEQVRGVKLPLAEAARAALEGAISHAASCALLLKAWLRCGSNV